jgi:BirA family biotin operon repressor/biotin-[acetyl-CoA-carboxylase] ligase
LSSLNPIGLPFIELATVDSTNNYAMGLAHAGMAQHGTAVFAHEQVRGKGQRNKTWVSTRGQNISMSIILSPELLSITPLFLLSMATALAVKRLLDPFSQNEMRIKWPNDLYWRDRKAAGILIENLWQGGRWKNAIVGIGININQEDFGELQSRAVSLKQITEQIHDPLSLAKSLCSELDIEYRLMAKNPESVRKYYAESLYKKGEWVRLKKGNRTFDARVLGVSDEGQLIVQHGMEERFDVGQVEWER